MKTYEALIADDNQRARQAIRLILEGSDQFQVIGEATNGIEAVEQAKKLMPDLVLMDINMPEMNGLHATRVIKQELPYVTVVILSVSDDASDLFEAIRSGAQGYLIKSLEPSEWLSYLHGMMDGDTPVSRTMAERILSAFKQVIPSKTDHADGYDDLTNRERDILQLVSTGTTNREIAAQLFISENTVKNHLKNIMVNLSIQNRVQLATYMTRRK